MRVILGSELEMRSVHHAATTSQQQPQQKQSAQIDPLRKDSSWVRLSRKQSINQLERPETSTNPLLGTSLRRRNLQHQLEVDQLDSNCKPVPASFKLKRLLREIITSIWAFFGSIERNQLKETCSGLQKHLKWGKIVESVSLVFKRFVEFQLESLSLIQDKLTRYKQVECKHCTSQPTGSAKNLHSSKPEAPQSSIKLSGYELEGDEDETNYADDEPSPSSSYCERGLRFNWFASQPADAMIGHPVEPPQENSNAQILLQRAIPMPMPMPMPITMPMQRIDMRQAVLNRGPLPTSGLPNRQLLQRASTQPLRRPDVAASQAQTSRPTLLGLKDRSQTIESRDSSGSSLVLYPMSPTMALSASKKLELVDFQGQTQSPRRMLLHQANVSREAPSLQGQLVLGDQWRGPTVQQSSRLHPAEWRSLDGEQQLEEPTICNYRFPSQQHQHQHQHHHSHFHKHLQQVSLINQRAQIQHHQHNHQHWRHSPQVSLSEAGIRSELSGLVASRPGSRIESEDAFRFARTRSGTQSEPQPQQQEASSSGVESSGRKLGSKLSKLSLAGAKRRFGFKRKGLTQISVHRSEEVCPLGMSQFNTVAAESNESQTQYDSHSTSVLERIGSERQLDWSQRLKHVVRRRSVSQELPPTSGFIESTGEGQIMSRQALVSPNLGYIQLSISDQRGILEIEVIRAKQLRLKPGARSLPALYIKVYLMKESKCIAKFRTHTVRQTLDPLFQQRFVFRDDYSGCAIQVIVWADYGRRDRKSLMGLAQIQLSQVDISSSAIDWYKLFNAPSISGPLMSSRMLRRLLVNTKQQDQEESTYKSQSAGSSPTGNLSSSFDSRQSSWRNKFTQE